MVQLLYFCILDSISILCHQMGYSYYQMESLKKILIGLQGFMVRRNLFFIIESIVVPITTKN